jgi:hypothetical protein
MTEEDEAFEDLAKRQGDWGMQGSRKHQILRYAENVESKETSMTDKEAMKLALDALEQMKAKANFECWNLDICDESIAALKEALAQEKALQALHNENERLGLYKDAYAEQEPLIGCVNHDCAKCKERTEQEPVAHLWECLGRWSAYLVNNGTQAECAPPSWLVDAVKNATTPPQRTEQEENKHD